MIKSLDSTASALCESVESAIYTMNLCKCISYEQFHHLDNTTIRHMELLKNITSQMEISALELSDPVTSSRWKERIAELKTISQRFIFCSLLSLLPFF